MDTRSNDNLGMKIGYDFPSHVNDVITSSRIAIYGVKHKNNPRIRINNFKPYFSKLFNYIQPTQGNVYDFMLTSCTQDQKL